MAGDRGDRSALYSTYTNTPFCFDTYYSRRRVRSYIILYVTLHVIIVHAYKYGLINLFAFAAFRRPHT